MEDKTYNWTVNSALYELQWEPTARRASAVSYLDDVILKGDTAELRLIAYRLLREVEAAEGSQL